MSTGQLPRGPHAALADAVMGRIRGQEDAKLIVRSVRRGQASENDLHEALQQQLATGDADRVRGFMSALQKAIGGGA